MRAAKFWINTFMCGAAKLPFGGFKPSGEGQALGRSALKAYTGEKTLHIHDGPRAGRWPPRP